MTIHPGKFTAQLDGPFVVFLIGGTINRPAGIGKFIRIYNTMMRIKDELRADPANGCLGGQRFFQWCGILTLQYWRSWEHWERYAHSPAHREAMKVFGQVMGSGDVSIWHETYQIEPGQYEALYLDSTVRGLAAVGRHVALD